MSASSTDYFTHVGSPGTATTLAAPGHSIGGTSLTVVSTSNWPTDTGAVFAMDTVTLVNGKEVRDIGSYTEWEGVVTDATTISGLVRRLGSDQNYPAGSTTRVYIPVASSRENRMVDGLAVSLDQDGTLKAGAVDNAAALASNVVTTAKILDANVTTAKIADDAVTPAKMLGIDIYGTTAALVGSAPAAGSGQFYIQTGSTVGFFASNALDISFPTPFPNGLLNIIICDGDSSTGVSMSVQNQSPAPTRSGFRAQSQVNGTQRVNWIALGF